jgi:hypothetical protein
LSGGIHLTEEQLGMQALAHDFAREQMLPHAAKWDEQKIFPVDVMREAAKLGFAGEDSIALASGCTSVMAVQHSSTAQQLLMPLYSLHAAAKRFHGRSHICCSSAAALLYDSCPAPAKERKHISLSTVKSLLSARSICEHLGPCLPPHCCNCCPKHENSEPYTLAAGLYVPEEYGGSGLGRLDGTLIFEGLSYGDISTAAYLTIHNMVAYVVRASAHMCCDYKMFSSSWWRISASHGSVSFVAMRPGGKLHAGPHGQADQPRCSPLLPS